MYCTVEPSGATKPTLAVMHEELRGFGWYLPVQVKKRSRRSGRRRVQTKTDRSFASLHAREWRTGFAERAGRHLLRRVLASWTGAAPARFRIRLELARRAVRTATPPAPRELASRARVALGPATPGELSGGTVDALVVAWAIATARRSREALEHLCRDDWGVPTSLDSFERTRPSNHNNQPRIIRSSPARHNGRGRRKRAGLLRVGEVTEWT